MTVDKTVTTPAKTRKKWSKKKLWLVAGGIPLAMVATTAAAAAIFAALAGIQGSGTNGEFTARWAQGSAATLDTSSLTVQPQGGASVSSGALVLPALTIYPSETFTVEGSVVSGGANQVGYVSGITMPGLPSGYTAEIVDGCGAKITTSMVGVKVRVTAPQAQTPGASWTLASDAGVRVTPLASAGSAVPGGVACAPYVAP